MDITLERIFLLMEHKENGKVARGGKARFARSIGYDSGDIVSMWESGASKSYLKKLHEIAAKYDVSVAWLKGETDDMGGTGQFQGDNPSGVPGAAAVAAGVVGAALLPGAAIAAIDTAGGALFAGKKKKPAPTNGGGLKASQYDKLTEENRALVDQMIEKLLKSQSGE